MAAVLVAEILGAVVLLRTPSPAPADGGARLADRIAADLAPATDAVAGFWDRPWDRNVRIVTTDTDQEFVAAAHLDPTGHWNDIAAVAVADSVDLARGTASGQRIVFAPGAAAMSEESLRVVVTHELFHLAARGATATDAPRWLTEGVADYVARPAAPVPVAMRGNTEFPSDAELDQSGPVRSAGYDRAWWFARFVADDFGIDGLRRLYHRACGPGHVGFAEAAREAIGVDMTQLHTRWARWLAAQ